MKIKNKSKSKEIVDIVKDLSKIYNLKELENDLSNTYNLTKLENFENEIKKYNEFSSNMLKILFIGYNFKQNEQLANQMLIDLISGSNTDELVAIFTKITIYSDEFIEYCKKYAKVKRLRSIITQIFKKLNITYEEAGIYNFTGMKEFTKIEYIKRLFQSINSISFKNNKNLILELIDEYKNYLPEPTETGFRNLKQIGKLDIFKDQFSYFNKSEIIRMEYFSNLKNFEKIYEFLYYNHFFNDIENIKNLGIIFKQKMKLLSNKKDIFPTYIDLICNGLVYKMCNSLNTHRKYLGTLYLLTISEYFPEIINKNLIINLIYDKSTEIRNVASKMKNLVDRNILTHLKNLLSTDSYKIYGSCILLEDISPEIILSELKDRFNKNEKSLLGFMCCLNYMNYKNVEYTLLVHKIYKKFIKIEDETYSENPSWGIIRECCIYYKNINRDDLLMECLLESDHLGLVSIIKDLIDINELDIKNYINKGIEVIKSKKSTVRKSGGLSQFYIVLNKNTENYDLIKESLFNLIAVDSSTNSLLVSSSDDRSVNISNNNKVSAIDDNEVNISINSIDDNKVNLLLNNKATSPGNNQIDNQMICLKNVEEHILFHTLNIFASIFDDYSEDHFLYLKLGFSCLTNKSFCIKNCGFVLLSLIFKKILIFQRTFDTFLLTRNEIRKYLIHMLEFSIKERNKYVIFFILYIYSNMNDRNELENQLILKCESIGEFITLKVKDINESYNNNCNSDNINNFNNSNSDIINNENIDNINNTFNSYNDVCYNNIDKTDINNTDKIIKNVKNIVNILITLNKNDENIRKTVENLFNLKDASFEFLIHKIIKNIDFQEEIKSDLINYQRKMLNGLELEVIYRSELDFSYILELLNNQ